jgi:hypothetical protein
MDQLTWGLPLIWARALEAVAVVVHGESTSGAQMLKRSPGLVIAIAAPWRNSAVVILVEPADPGG